MSGKAGLLPIFLKERFQMKRGRKRGGKKTTISSPFTTQIADMHKGRGGKRMRGGRGKKR